MPHAHALPPRDLADSDFSVSSSPGLRSLLLAESLKEIQVFLLDLCHMTYNNNKCRLVNSNTP